MPLFQSRSDQLQREVTELRAEQSRLCEDKHKLQKQLELAQESKRRDERQLAEQLNNFERQVTEKMEALEQLRRSYDEVRAQLDNVQHDKEKKRSVWLCVCGGVEGGYILCVCVCV